MTTFLGILFAAAVLCTAAILLMSTTGDHPASAGMGSALVAFYIGVPAIVVTGVAWAIALLV
jgi:hypothetical protein